METVATFKIEGVEPVTMGYEDGQYHVSYCETLETFEYYNEAEMCFKELVSLAMDDYR